MVSKSKKQNLSNRISSPGKTELDLARFKAVIFDMDGVITETAVIHAAAWKQLFDEYLKERVAKGEQGFAPFEIDPDYYEYIDGKPRYDGVKSFLKSRGVSIPYGETSDGPDAETVCGLGNREDLICALGDRKDGYFLDRLEKQGAKPFQSTVRLVTELRRRGIPIAAISASRNGRRVLKSAAVEDLFDTIVDGVDSSRLKLTGKPAPDIFLEASRRLGVKPQNAVVIEDALAGVQAGRAGGFGMVIGVDRAGRGRQLQEGGATTVVRDLAEIEIVDGIGPEAGMPARKPSALENLEEIFQRLREGVPAIFLDYDGTLTDIVEDPAKAHLPRARREIVSRLSQSMALSIISGRDLEDVRSLVGLDDIYYAGSHGFNISGPGGYYDESKGEPFLPALDAAEGELRISLEGVPGVLVERKRFAIAVHFRRAPDSAVPDIERVVDEIAGKTDRLRKTGGKKIFELRPNVDWDKGKAIFALIDRLHLGRPQVVPLYIGDDLTDEDAFKAIESQGIGIAVMDTDRGTAAGYVLKDTGEVERFLQELTALAEREISHGAWTLTYDGFLPEKEGLRESLCTLGNGNFATRGSAPESNADGVHYPGTYIAGCYNRLKDVIEGRTIENESLVNAPNWLPLTFRAEGAEWFDPAGVKLQDYRQELDLKRGILHRFIRFSDREGRQTRVNQRRLVNMAYPHLATMETTIVAENWSGNLEIRSALDGRVTNTGVDRYKALASRHLQPVAQSEADDETICLQVETNQSHIRIAQAARTRIFSNGGPAAAERRTVVEPGYIAQEFPVRLEQGKQIIVEKTVSVFTSRDRAISEAATDALTEVHSAPDFSDLLDRHVLAWKHLWDRCHIEVEMDHPRAAQILHLHVFHLLQTVSPHSIDLDIGVPPRGLHGEAYRGHILWDELFIFPFLNLRIPHIPRALLMYRYRRLVQARRAAKQAGFQGAMFPWQSGSNGQEESQRIHLNPLSGRWIPDNSHLQRHIGIAIAYNVWHHYQATGDTEFFSFYGAELILEIARFLASITAYNKSTGRYEIRGVMGPDEFHEGYPGAENPGVDNNAYTNVMAVWVFCRALEAIELMPEERRKPLLENLAVTQEETQRWEVMSRNMLVPFHGEGIISQFQGYEELEEYDWEEHRRKYQDGERLDRILEAENDTPDRYKASKQADVLMLFYLLSAEELRDLFERLGYPFEHETIPRNIEYYMGRTSHGSTLSRVVHSWVLARSMREKSWNLFQDALESDVSDIQGGTTKEGIHLGAMAGTVDLVQRCYTGIEIRGDILRLHPQLPEGIRRLEFDIRYRQHLLHLRMNGKSLVISARPCEARSIKIGFKDEVLELSPGNTLQFNL